MFDFDATLPLMAVQFLLLTLLLNAVFYKPLTKALDERDQYIRQKEIDARERVTKAEQLIKEYNRQISEARRESQAIVERAQAEARNIVAQKIAEAQQQAQAEREEASREIQQQKEAALASLEQEVDVLSRQILDKLLGPELVKS
jgi:F-type H+-transporting ATPase subunit b